MYRVPNQVFLDENIGLETSLHETQISALICTHSF